MSNEVSKDKEARRIQKAHISLMRNKEFALYSGILMVGKVTIEDDFPTAATNGRDVVYGRKFVQQLDDKELAFVVLHENMHKAMQHITMWEKLYRIDPVLANAACDYVVNLELKDLDPEGKFISMPKVGGLLDEKYRGMNSKQVFDLLRQQYPNRQQSDGDGNEDGSGTGTPKQGKGNGKDAPKGFDEHDWNSGKKMSKAEKDQLAKDIDSALRQGVMAAKKAGSKAGGLSRELSELLEPKIDWREELREFMKSTCANKDRSSWRRPNRRYIGNDVYMPTLIGEAIGRIIIGIDTSGSIGGEALNNFLSEVKDIAEEVRPEQIDLLYWDAEVASHEIYTRSELDNLVSSTKPAGGGGTSPSCVTDWIKHHKVHPECSIMLTDGYVGNDWGKEWPSPVLWCVLDNEGATAPNGKTLHIES